MIISVIMATEIKPFSRSIDDRHVAGGGSGSSTRPMRETGIGLVALFETDDGEPAHEGDIMWSVVTQENKDSSTQVGQVRVE